VAGAKDPTTRPIGDLIPTIGGSGAHPGRGIIVLYAKPTVSGNSLPTGAQKLEEIKSAFKKDYDRNNQYVKFFKKVNKQAKTEVNDDVKGGAKGGSKGRKKK
jgi:hypothetical protein